MSVVKLFVTIYYKMQSMTADSPPVLPPGNLDKTCTGSLWFLPSNLYDFENDSLHAFLLH